MKTSKLTTRICLALALIVSPMAALALQTERAHTPVTRYNMAGQATGTIAPDPDGGGPLRYLATRHSYDTRGLLARIERGELSAWLDESVAPQNWGNSATFTILSTTEFTYDGFGRKSAEIVRGTDGTIESLVQFSYGANNLMECKAIRMNPGAFASPQTNACEPGSTGAHGADRITRYAYDALDQVARVDRAVGVAGLQQAYITNTYSHRQLRALTDANGNRTELRYDSYGRLARRVYPHPSATGSVNESDYNEYTYYDNGNLRTERKRDGSTITYTYDGLNRPTVKDFSDPSMPDVFYNYDLRGLTLYSRFSGDDGQGETNQYNGFGELSARTSNVSGTSRSISYRHDANGNRTRVTHPDGFFFEYAFDGLNRVTGVSSSTSASADSAVSSLLTVAYASDGMRHSIARSAGMTTTYLRDNAGRLESFRQVFPDSADSLENAFQYDPAGQIRELVQGNDRYNFRSVANRTGAYFPNGLNQYQSVGGRALSYDAKGNLIVDGATTYRYDMENHLLETVGGENSTLGYDTLGRLARFTIDGTTTQFLYDGDALVGEYVNGALTRRYVHGDQVDEPWIQYEGSGVAATDRRYLFADHQGSVIAQANNSGHVLIRNTYDPYGIPANGNLGRFGYTGQTWLPVLGFNYYKARFYSPRLGRFLQTDPIYYRDDMNLYAYVGSDPMNKIDPSGESEREFFDPRLREILLDELERVNEEEERKSDRSRDHDVRQIAKTGAKSEVCRQTAAVTAQDVAAALPAKGRLQQATDGVGGYVEGAGWGAASLIGRAGLLGPGVSSDMKQVNSALGRMILIAAENPGRTGTLAKGAAMAYSGQASARLLVGSFVSKAAGPAIGMSVAGMAVYGNMVSATHQNADSATLNEILDAALLGGGCE